MSIVWTIVAANCERCEVQTFAMVKQLSGNDSHCRLVNENFVFIAQKTKFITRTNHSIEFWCSLAWHLPLPWNEMKRNTRRASVSYVHSSQQIFNWKLNRLVLPFLISHCDTNNNNNNNINLFQFSINSQTSVQNIVVDVHRHRRWCCVYC